MAKWFIPDAIISGADSGSQPSSAGGLADILRRMAERMDFYSGQSDDALVREAKQALSAFHAISRDSNAYECAGCGRHCSDPGLDLEALRGSGHISCCPERKMVHIFDRHKAAMLAVEAGYPYPPALANEMFSVLEGMKARLEASEMRANQAELRERSLLNSSQVQRDATRQLSNLRFQLLQASKELVAEGVLRTKILKIAEDCLK